MSERLKRILIIVGFVVSVFAFAIALYFMFFRGDVDRPTATVEDQGIDEFSSLPESLQQAIRDALEQEDAEGLVSADDVARGGLTETITLTTSAVDGLVISSDGSDATYYDSTDGRFYRIDENGVVVALSSAQFPEVETVVWNKNAEKAVLEFPDGSNIIYDFSTESQVSLPSHWEDFDFSPTSNEIIAKSIGLDPDNRWLLFASDDGSNVRSFQALGENEAKVEVNWSPNDQVVAFANTAEEQAGGLDRAMIFPVGKNDENFQGLVVEGIGFESLWSPNGKQLLYSVTGNYSDYMPLLWIVDATSSTMGENRSSLSLNTWVDKCVFGSSSTIYCAVPIDLPINAGLKRSVYSDLDDVLYKIDLKSGRSSLLAIPAESTSMNNLIISDDEDKLYFTNTDGELELMYL
jgi:hypothetical protein